MATFDVQSIYTNGACYVCFGAAEEELLRLTLLAAAAGGPPININLPRAVLTLTPGTAVINWSVTGATPDTANIQFSTNNGITWIGFGSFPWAQGSATVPSDFLYRVTGIQFGVQQVTRPSAPGVFVPLHATATSWQTRVQNNGGAAPSTKSVNAMSDLCYRLDAQTLTSSIISMNMFAPDSLIAAITPLIVGGMSDPWVNASNLFVTADVSINGMTGDGASKFLGIHPGPSAIYAGDNSAGVFVYEATTVNGTTCPIGAANTGSTRAHELFTNSFATGVCFYDCWDNDNTHGRVDTGSGPHQAGFFLGSRTAANASAIYFANSTNAWGTLGTSANLSTGTHLTCTHDYGVFCQNTDVGQFFFSSRTISAAGITLGLSSAQGQALFNAVDACRRQLGGGFV